jgi:carbohydrate esterase-like sialic acid-specific acetylesterase
MEYPPRNVGCAPPGNRTLVFLITGQSNAGHYGRGARPLARQGIYNVYHKTLWLACDPLLGSDSLGISPWIPFAENLLQRGTAQSVVLALTVRGGMGVRERNPGARMRTEVFARVADLRAMGLTPDYLLWQQGEDDAPFHTRPEDYRGTVRGLVAALRESGIFRRF